MNYPMNYPSTDVLMFVEDPGSANYMAPLPAALAEHGWSSTLLSAGSAREYLHERGLSTVEVPRSTTAEQVLHACDPHLLLVGTAENPATFGLELIRQARQRALESVGVVDLQAHADYRWRGSSTTALAYAPDWLVVPDAWTQEAYVGLGYPRQQTVICGHPHYDRVRAIGVHLAQEERQTLRQRVLPGAAAKRPVVVFLAEVSTGLNPSQYQRSSAYTLTGRGTSPERTAVVLEEFLDAMALLSPRPYLVLRLHPKNTPDEFAAYLPAFDLVSRGGMPYELVYAADLVVGMTTMLLFEAALMGRPTLSIVPRAVEQTWLPGLQTGLIPCVGTRSALRKTLRAFWQQPARLRPADLANAYVRDALVRTVAFLQQRLRSYGDRRPRAA
jgi:hypothetical protein